MGYLLHFLTFLEVVTALLLIGIILIQQSKTGGGLGAVGGGMTETVFGAGAGNVLTKGTVWLATLFFCLTLLVAVITGRGDLGGSVGDGLESEVSEQAEMAVPGGEEVTTEAGETAVEVTTEVEKTGKPVEAAVEDAVPTPAVPVAPEKPKTTDAPK
ncbi:MAG: preprotein translocase subunit SecG [Lentisphaeria bacterium]|nr:preprotein translocase subunit SecG [Lentisphaeria bacterium]